MTEATDPNPLMRRRDGRHAKVTYEELFFDLVYVFAVTQLSHHLLHNLSLMGALETLVLWFAVWLGWQYTCWVTNWFNPETPPIRRLMFGLMLAALVMASAIPGAFGERALVFALSYVTIQVGRTAYIIWELGPHHKLSAGYRRTMGWLSISAVFWISGAFAEHEMRIVLWVIAAACEYIAPMLGFALPGMGRSYTKEWTIEGGHLAERCQLFVIVALGETLLASGAMLSDTEVWSPAIILAVLVTFAGTLAMWWLYFGTSSKDATHAITHSDDPGRIGAYLHYVHAVMVAGIIGTAVGNDMVLGHPHMLVSPMAALMLCGGPACYLIGSAILRNVVYHRWPASHLIGVAALAVVALLAGYMDLLIMGCLTTAIMVAVGLLERRAA